MSDPTCLNPEHHRVECQCGLSAKCEGCGTIRARCGYTLVRLLNGGLYLCANCLAEFNGKNPELKAVKAENAELRRVAGELYARIIAYSIYAQARGSAPFGATVEEQAALAAAAPLCKRKETTT